MKIKNFGKHKHKKSWAQNPVGRRNTYICSNIGNVKFLSNLNHLLSLINRELLILKLELNENGSLRLDFCCALCTLLVQLYIYRLHLFVHWYWSKQKAFHNPWPPLSCRTAHHVVLRVMLYLPTSLLVATVLCCQITCSLLQIHPTNFSDYQRLFSLIFKGMKWSPIFLVVLSRQESNGSSSITWLMIIQHFKIEKHVKKPIGIYRGNEFHPKF